MSKLKKLVATTLLRGMRARFDRSESSLDRLMGQAIRLQRGEVSDEAFRVSLEKFYEQTECEELAVEIELRDLQGALDRPDARKIGIVRLAADRLGRNRVAFFNFWRRRFALLHHIHVRCDVLVLRQDEQIPPHGHRRVVSGFYLLQGQVACRHYDCVREEEGDLLVRPVVDTVHEPGGFTTNSEQHHNIHWLQGIAGKSYLFRVTATHTPTAAFGNAATANERVYVDPTTPPGPDGLIRARYVSEGEAKKLSMPPFVAQPPH